MPRIALPKLMGFFVVSLLLNVGAWIAPAHAQATYVQTPYKNPKALIDIYLDDPRTQLSARRDEPPNGGALQPGA